MTFKEFVDFTLLISLIIFALKKLKQSYSFSLKSMRYRCPGRRAS